MSKDTTPQTPDALTLALADVLAFMAARESGAQVPAIGKRKRKGARRD
jgi:hypothetical protein